MRSYLLLQLALWIAACGETNAPPINRISLFAPGLEITIDDKGRGKFFERATQKRGRFSLTTVQLTELMAGLEAFRKSRETMTAEHVGDYVTRHRCDGDYVTDQGGLTIHWQGPSVDQFYVADYGCRRDQHADRNKRLQALLALLPVPAPEPLP
jgi:hypothetical protein